MGARGQCWEDLVGGVVSSGLRSFTLGGQQKDGIEMAVFGSESDVVNLVAMYERKIARKRYHRCYNEDDVHR